MIVLCANGVSYPFSLPPGGGSTRAARGRKGDFGERESWEGDGVGPSVWLSESPLFFSWAWKQEMRRFRTFGETEIKIVENGHVSCFMSRGLSVDLFVLPAEVTFKAEGSIPGNRATLWGGEATAGWPSAPLACSSESESSSLLSTFVSVSMELKVMRWAAVIHSVLHKYRVHHFDHLFNVNWGGS